MKDYGYIDYTTYKFLLSHSPPRTSLFYLLPELHKPSIPGHLIIWGCDYPTDNLSKYIEHYLTPSSPHPLLHQRHYPFPQRHSPNTNTTTTQHHPCHNWRNIPLHQHRKQRWNRGSNPSTFHTSTQHNTTTPTMFQNPTQLYPQLTQLLSLQQPTLPTSTRHNYGHTHDFLLCQHFHGFFRKTEMLLHSPHNLLPFTWLRFIADIFMLWTHESSSLTTFLQHINTFHPRIKFSHQQSHTSINFLDTTILLTKEHTLQSTSNPTTKVYYSTTPLTTQQPVKKGVIYCQALQYQRIITDDDDLRLHLLGLHKILLFHHTKSSTSHHLPPPVSTSNL